MMPATPFAQDPRPIGVFDSGVGGLTVLRALMAAMPGEDFLYLGDTARVPYGTKSAETVRSYALGLARVLLDKNVKMLVIACNTASVHAAEAIAAYAAPVPVVSMIAPAADAAARATRNNHVLLMGTESTVRSGAYEKALHALDPAIRVTRVPAQVLVALAEEGWVEGAVAQAAIARYIGAFFTNDEKPDTIILGCTHFPLLKNSIAALAGPGIVLVDSGEEAARAICAQFGGRTGQGAATPHFYVTDAPARFVPLAARFLGCPVAAERVEHIDLAAFGEARKDIQQEAMKEEGKALCSI